MSGMVLLVMQRLLQLRADGLDDETVLVIDRK